MGRKAVIQINPRKEKGFELDIGEFVRRLIDAIMACIEQLRNRTYNETIRRELPYRHRIGTILRRDYRAIFPEYKKEYFKEISQEDISDFLTGVTEREVGKDKPVKRIREMTAGLFYRRRALGYRANGYKDSEKLSSKEQYFRYADGRDDGLSEIDENSAEAFDRWLTERQPLGHPWEVCRGGNSTHVSLYAQKDETGYYFALAGSSYSRSIETIKFYSALARENVPVCLYDAKALAARIAESDKIGIVPEDVLPVYCERIFPDEKILDFINLPCKKGDIVADKAVWQKIDEQRLL